MDHTMRDLRKYAESFPNGTLEEVIDNKVEEDDDIGVRATSLSPRGGPVVTVVRRYLDEQHDRVQRFLGNREGLRRPENMTGISRTRWIATSVKQCEP